MERFPENKTRTSLELFGGFASLNAGQIREVLDNLGTLEERNELYLYVCGLSDAEQGEFTSQFVRNYLWERVSPQTILDAMFQSEMAPKDTVQHRLLGELVHNFNYRFTFDNPATEKAIEEMIESGDFFRLGVFLDTLLSVYRAGHSAPNPEVRTNNVRWLVESVLKQSKIPALLKIRAESLLAAMENESEHSPTEIYEDVAPFPLFGSTYGWVNEHRVHVINDSENDRASQLAGQAMDIGAGKIPDTPVEYEFGNLEMGGEFIPVPTKRTAQSQLYQATKELSMHPLSPDHLSVASQQDRLSDQDMYDFAYILSRPVRERLESKLGVSLFELSLPTQYRFLEFIKQRPDQSEIEFERDC